MLVHVLALVAVAVMPQESKPSDDFNRLTPDQLKAGIEKRHPAAYYVLAGKLFNDGARDEAVFWFYAGQLRYRLHLAANPKLPPSGDPALFASFAEVLGRPINEYAFGDLDQLKTTIEKVLAWDERTDNGFTPKTSHDAMWKAAETERPRESQAIGWDACECKDGTPRRSSSSTPLPYLG